MVRLVSVAGWTSSRTCLPLFITTCTKRTNDDDGDDDGVQTKAVFVPDGRSEQWNPLER